jgi:hypothetical protein
MEKEITRLQRDLDDLKREQDSKGGRFAEKADRLWRLEAEREVIRQRLEEAAEYLDAIHFSYPDCLPIQGVDLGQLLLYAFERVVSLERRAESDRSLLAKKQREIDELERQIDPAALKDYWRIRLEIERLQGILQSKMALLRRLLPPPPAIS